MLLGARARAHIFALADILRLKALGWERGGRGAEATYSSKQADSLELRLNK